MSVIYLVYPIRNDSRIPNLEESRAFENKKAAEEFVLGQKEWYTITKGKFGTLDWNIEEI